MDKDDILPLVTELNMLLEALNIPIQLTSLLDLIPSLLTAILDAIIGDDLSSEMSTCLAEHNLSNTSMETTPVLQNREYDIERVQIFLGVLEHDVIKADVGLHKIDPIRLAEGEWEETLLVATVLCWFGRHHGLIPELRTSSPTTTLLTRTTSLSIEHTSSTAFMNLQEESMTSIDEDEYNGSTPSDSFSFLPEPSSPFISYTPALNPEITSLPSLLLGADDTTIKLARKGPEGSDNTSSDKLNSNNRSSVGVRYEGYIDLADEMSEISWYEHHSRSMSPPKASGSMSQDLSQETKRTLMFLDKRASLLSELQQLKRRER
ncbi:hypothetical protein BDQ17DRAFT_1361242 [Cyathus striatus]|nr:hypothetical protein BDQ17DRAFT_1361242 [Cyathus striatus]